jgi:hypothetical protein
MPRKPATKKSAVPLEDLPKAEVALTTEEADAAEGGTLIGMLPAVQKGQITDGTSNIKDGTSNTLMF